MTPAEISSRPISNTQISVRTGVPSEKRFFFMMSVICALTILVGFSPSYYLKGVFHAPPPLSAMTYVHGFVFTAWVLVFVLQAGLIGYDKPALHRRLGLLAALLFGAVVAIGIMTGIAAGRLEHAPPGSPAPLIFMAVPISAIAGAAILMIAALWNRAKRDFHMRYMLAAFIAMTPPAMHRLALGAGFPTQALWFSFAMADTLLGIAIFYDMQTRRSVHPAYLWSVLVYVGVEGGIIWAYSSAGWLPIAHWLIQA